MQTVDRTIASLSNGLLHEISTSPLSQLAEAFSQVRAVGSDQLPAWCRQPGKALGSVALLVALAGCGTLSVRTASSLCLNPLNERCLADSDSRPIAMRIYQLQKSADPTSMGIRWDEFRDSPRDNPVPARLKPYLADPQAMDYPVIANFEVSPQNTGAQTFKVSKHKNTQYALVVMLGERSGFYSARSVRLLPLEYTINLCVDHFDVFPNCQTVSLDIRTSRCPSPAGDNCNFAGRVSVYQLEGDPAAVGLQAAALRTGVQPGLPIDREPAWLRKLLVNERDPGARTDFVVAPDRRQTVTLRIVEDPTRRRLSPYLLIVSGSATPGGQRIVRTAAINDQALCIDKQRLFFDGEDGYDFCRNAIEEVAK